MKYILYLSLFLHLSYESAFSQNIKDLKLDNKQSILGDRAFLTFPTAAVNSQRPTDIMSADHNKNEETRILLDIGKMRLVFFARELYKLADPTFPADMASWDNDMQFHRKVLTDNDRLISVLSTPGIFDSTANAILINSLLVKTADNTVFEIDAYINPDAYPSREEFIKLSEDVFKTLAKGSRTNERQRREETLDIFQTYKKFKFALPADYCITQDQQYDFQVFKFHKYALLSDTNWISLIIYVGRHPSSFYREYGFDAKDAKKVPGTFLGNTVEWTSFANDEKKLYIKERQINYDKLGDGLVIHVVMMSGSPGAIGELTKIVEGIEMK